MNRPAQSVVLLLLGGALLRISITDDYLRYVKEGLRPLLLGAGALLVLVALATLWAEFRGQAEEHDGHDHAPGGPKIAWLLLLPVLALVLVAPPALGSYAAAHSGTALSSQQGASDYPPLPAGDPVKISVLDYASRAVFDAGRSLAGRRVALTGFVSVDAAGTPYLTRMILTCCAADARPIKVGLAGTTADLKADDWIEVVGTYTTRTGKDAVNEEAIPYLEVTSLRSVAAPKKQYE